MSKDRGATPANPLELAYAAHYGALVESVAPILGCRFQAQDVVQDAWVRLAERPPVETIRQPASYLFRLVRNLAIDRARRLALEIRYGAREDVPLTAPSGAPSPEETAIAGDLLRDLERALADLPDRARLIFEMNRMGGQSVEEIAAALEVSQGYVYRLLRQATVHCARRLGPVWGPPGR